MEAVLANTATAPRIIALPSSPWDSFAVNVSDLVTRTGLNRRPDVAGSTLFALSSRALVTVGGYKPDAEVDGNYVKQHYESRIGTVVLDDGGCVLSGWMRKQPGGDSPTALIMYAAVVAQGRIFLHGGRGMHGASDQLHSYNAELNVWSLVSASASPRRFAHTMVLYKQRNLYLFGGSDESAKPTNTVYMLDLRSLATGWRAVPTAASAAVDSPCPVARSSHASVVWRNQMLVFGGMSATAYLNDLWSLDLLTNCWTLLHDGASTPAPLPRTLHHCFLWRSYVLLIGGSAKNTFYDDMWLFDLGQSQWVRVDITSGFKLPGLRDFAAELIGDAVRGNVSVFVVSV